MCVHVLIKAKRSQADGHSKSERNGAGCLEHSRPHRLTRLLAMLPRISRSVFSLIGAKSRGMARKPGGANSPRAFRSHLFLLTS